MEKLKYRIRLVIGISMILAIPLSFIFSRFIESGIDSVLHMKVDPRFSGGAEIARFMDPVGDDDGASDYTYPLNGMFDGRGYLDLVRYVVNEPITNAPWSADADFWQVAFTFDKTANADDSIYSFSHPVIHLYIDIDGKAGGSTETLDPRGEKVQFDPEHPWDIMIQIDGHHKYGKLVSFDGSIKEKVTIFLVKEKNTVYARIPLTQPLVKRVLDGRVTYHYVLIGAYDHLAQGNFLPVKKEAALRNGGGALSDLAPNVYDYLAPKNKSQKRVLSSYNETNQSFATVYPVEVKRQHGSANLKNNDDEIARLTTQMESEGAKSKEHTRSEIKSKSKDGTPRDLLSLNFRIGEFAEAERIASSLLKSNPNDPIALAYEGSLIAMKGGQTKSAAQAMQFVNAGYEKLDAAVRNASTDEEKITAYSARGSVSMSVPDSVFNKSVQGADDFMRVAALYANRKETYSQAGESLVKAGLCLIQTGRIDEGELLFMKAKQYPLSSYSKIQLLKRGFDL